MTSDSQAFGPSPTGACIGLCILRSKHGAHQVALHRAVRALAWLNFRLKYCSALKVLVLPECVIKQTELRATYVRRCLHASLLMPSLAATLA